MRIRIVAWVDGSLAVAGVDPGMYRGRDRRQEGQRLAHQPDRITSSHPTASTRTTSAASRTTVAALRTGRLIAAQV
jgi:hypothetical protein